MIANTFANAIAAFENGNPAAAAELCRHILEQVPGHADALHVLGVAEHQLGRSAAAIAALTGAVAADPGNAACRTNLGAVLQASERYAEAIECFRHALALTPGNVEALLNLATSLQADGRLQESIETFEELVRIAPAFPPGLLGLASALTSAGRLDDALQFQVSASRHAPEYADAHAAQGITLRAMGRFAEAAEAHRRAIRLAPDSAAYHANLGLAQKDAGELAASEAAYRTAIARQPGFADAYFQLAIVLLMRGDSRGVLQLREAYEREHPRDRTFLAFAAIAHDAMGDGAEAARILDYDGLIAQRRIAPPAGWETLDRFNATLAEHLLSHPGLTARHGVNTTQSGRQTGDILSRPTGPLEPLVGRLAEEVARYLDERPVDPAHPFLSRRPERWSISGWAVVLERGGFQNPHFHGDAWISGVYYVSLPPSVASPKGAHDGWIEFGRPPASVAPDFRHPTRMVQPAEGSLLLFPSYLYHRTIPFDDEATRICIAFDAIENP